MSTKKQSPQKSMSLLEFVDKNGEGLACFVIVVLILGGGLALQFCGRQ